MVFCSFVDIIYKFELVLEIMEISIECKLEDFVYIFKLYKFKEEIIEEGIMFYFDYD